MRRILPATTAAYDRRHGLEPATGVANTARRGAAHGGSHRRADAGARSRADDGAPHAERGRRFRPATGARPVVAGAPARGIRRRSGHGLDDRSGGPRRPAARVGAADDRPRRAVRGRSRGAADGGRVRAAAGGGARRAIRARRLHAARADAGRRTHAALVLRPGRRPISADGHPRRRQRDHRVGPGRRVEHVVGARRALRAPVALDAPGASTSGSATPTSCRKGLDHILFVRRPVPAARRGCGRCSCR